MPNIIQGQIAPDFQRLAYQPANYTLQSKTLRGHLAAIDAALSEASGGAPLAIAFGSSFRVRANTQIVYVLPIRCDGPLIVDGALIQLQG